MHHEVQNDQFDLELTSPLDVAFSSFRIFMLHVFKQALKTYIQFSEFTQIKSLQLAHATKQRPFSWV